MIKCLIMTKRYSRGGAAGTFKQAKPALELPLSTKSPKVLFGPNGPKGTYVHILNNRGFRGACSPKYHSLTLPTTKVAGFLPNLL